MFPRQGSVFIKFMIIHNKLDVILLKGINFNLNNCFCRLSLNKVFIAHNHKKIKNKSFYVIQSLLG